MKNILIVLLCVLLPVCVHAQFGAGVKAGLNVPMVIVDDADIQENLAPTLGVHIGAHGYFMFNKNIGIEAGLMLTQAGYSTQVDEEWEGVSLNYFTIPISARFKWGYFTLNPGIQPSFMMSAKFMDNDVSDNYNKTDVFLFVTPGIEFPMGLTLGSTISIGTMNVSNSDNNDLEAANLVFQFSVGYNFIRPK